jgi:hypothetical protein
MTTTTKPFAIVADYLAALEKYKRYKAAKKSEQADFWRKRAEGYANTMNAAAWKNLDAVMAEKVNKAGKHNG